MNAFLAIISDTWLQSRRQVVFIIMAFLLLLLSIVTAVVPTVGKGEDGNETFAFLWYEPVTFLDEWWVQTYTMSLIVQSDEKLNPWSEEGRAQERIFREKRREVEQNSTHISHVQRSIECLAAFAVELIFMVGMLLFIGASASYFPNMLESGAVDVVLSKPLTRGYVLLAKYLGGLALFTVLIIACYSILVVGLGLRTGHWPVRLFIALPTQVFSAAVLFSMVAATGILFRGTAVAMILSYVFYVVVDTAVGAVLSFQQLGFFSGEGWEWLDQSVEFAKLVLPNFGFLKKLTATVCLNIPTIEWTPIYVAAVWMVGMLLFGYWKFRRTDFS